MIRNYFRIFLAKLQISMPEPKCVLLLVLAAPPLQVCLNPQHRNESNVYITINFATVVWKK